MLGMILQNAIQLLLWVECSSNIAHFCETSVPICGMWISQQHTSQATHASWKGNGVFCCQYVHDQQSPQDWNRLQYIYDHLCKYL